MRGMEFGPLRGALTALAAVTLCGLLPQAASATVVPPLYPEEDSFYAPPANYAKKAPGTVLRERGVPLGRNHESVISTKITDAAAAYELLYRTTDSTGQPTATVATVLVPKEPAAGPRRLVSENVAEDSETQTCAPSYTLRLSEAAGLDAITAERIATALGHGWDVVVSDYEGPQSQLIVGPIEGQATLDGIRAAENFSPGHTGLEGSATEVAMLGYSGGSVPTVWADALAPTYARNVNLVAAAAGGVGANIDYVIAHGEGSPYFGGVVDALVSIDRAFPELEPYSLLNAKGLEAAASDGTDAKGCGAGVVSAPFGKAAEYTNYASTEELTEVPRVHSVLEKLNLNAPSEPVPAAPTYIYNSMEDEVFRFAQAEAMVAKFCAGNDSVDFQRATGSHLAGFFAYYKPAIAFIESQFAGQSPTNTC